MLASQFIFVARRRVATFALLALSCSVPLAAHAQQPAHQGHRPAASAVPSTATTLAPTISTLVPVPQPQSMLDRYQRFDADTPLLDWVSANKTVQQIGGWRAYAREAAASAAAALAATSHTPPLKSIPQTNSGVPK